MKLRGSRPGHLRNPIGSKLTRRGRTINDAARVMNDAAIISAARIDPVVFASYVMKDEETGRPIELAPVHIEWHDLLSAHDRVVVWSATELGKTSQISIARVLWEIGRNPNLRIAIVSATIGLAKKIIKSIKTYIERSTEYRRVFPGVVADKSATTGLWKDNAFHVKRDTISKDPTVQAIGFEGAFLGARADLIIIDDYLTPETTFSQHMRDKTHRWLKATVEGRKTARCRFWFVGNAWHRDDAMHRYAKEPGTRSRKYAVRDLLGNSRWPAMWPDARIEKEIANRGPIESQRSMFCNPASDADRRFKESYIVRALQLGDGDRLAHALNHVPTGWRIITGVDLAVSKKDSADMTALVTVAIDRDDNHRVLDIFAARLSGPEIVEKIVEVQRRYSSFVFVESNAAQRYIKQFVDKRHAMPIRAFNTGKNKTDPAFGIESLATEMGNGKWSLPNDGGTLDGSIPPEVNKLVEQMLSYDPLSHTGDELMACLVPGETVMTRGGPVAIEDVSAGTEVLTHRGRWRHVTGVESRPYAGDVVTMRPRGAADGPTMTIEHPVYAASVVSDHRSRTNRQIPGRWDWIDAGAIIEAGRKPIGHLVKAPVPSEWGSTDEDPFILGLFMAEGSTAHHQICFSFHERETYLVDAIREWASRRWNANITIVRSENSRGIRVLVNSKRAADFFRPFSKRGTKAIPWSMLPSDPISCALIARGWFVGDGSITKKRCFVGVTVAKAWRDQLVYALRRAGLLPAISPWKNKPFVGGGSVLPAWRVGLSARDTAALIGMGNGQRGDEIERWGSIGKPTRERSNSAWLAVDDGVASKVNIGRRAYSGVVYNLHVDEDESFVVEGVAVHNCWIAREGGRITKPGGLQQGKRKSLV